MPTDLSYFKESELNKFYIWDFIKSLPSDKVKQIFRNSLSSGLMERGEGSYEIVLQGYRGPHANGSSGDSEKLDACYGLQEVKYWYGKSKMINFLPIIGNVAYALSRTVHDTSWHSIYFDSPNR